MKSKALFLGILAAGLALAGCGDGDSSTSSTTPDSTGTGSSSIADSDPWVDYDLKTIADLIELAAPYTGEDPSPERYYVAAHIDEVTDEQYGAMTISDETGTLEVYGTYSADGELRYSALQDKPVAGDEVLLYGNLKMYKGEAEIYSGWIIDYASNQEPADPSDYQAMTVAEAREAEDGTLVRVSGIVARRTYASGMSPTGFLLVDGSSSIYVHGAAAANQVEEGNTVTLRGEKDHWILDGEKDAAAEVGYKGSNQIADAYVEENDKGKADPDYSWVEETTVRDIMRTPLSEDFTGLVHKVNAVIRKVPGSGFVNYYINDLDDATGSYCYSQANGNDFGWLDEFDGKICTVYLTVLNAKCGSTGSFWRFQPADVIDEGYKMDIDQADEFVADYFIREQFQEVYYDDPDLELIQSWSSELLGIDEVLVSYSSSDTDVIWFEEISEQEGGDKILLHTGTKHGTATITVNVVGNSTTTFTLDISYSEPPTYEHISIAEAIAKPVGEEVIVKGVVGPSTVNWDAFYLLDGEEAITCAQGNVEQGVPTIFDSANIGDIVYLKGTRDVWKSSSKEYGQICLTDCEVLSVESSGNDWHQDWFIEGKTLADLAALDVNDMSNTTDVYFVEDIVLEVVENPNYINLYLTQGDTKSQLYTSSAKQYPDLLALGNGAVVDMYLAPINRNSKDPFKFCALSWINADGTETVNAANWN